jgi:ribose 5-phosphate isomerase A
VADAGKQVDRLGVRAPLPVAVVPFGWESHLGFLRDLGAEPSLRRAKAGEPFVTDDGLYLLDCRFAAGLPDPHVTEARLHARTGVVETGLFLDLAEAAYVGDHCGVMVYRRGRTCAPTTGELD